MDMPNGLLDMSCIYIDFENNNQSTLALHLYTFVCIVGIRKGIIVINEERRE